MSVLRPFKVELIHKIQRFYVEEYFEGVMVGDLLQMTNPKSIEVYPYALGISHRSYPD